MATQYSIDALKTILRLVEAVRQRDISCSMALKQAKRIMYDRMVELVKATRKVFRMRSTNVSTAGEIMTPEDSNTLMDAAINCVRAVGECVAQTQFVLARLGEQVVFASMMAKFPAPVRPGEGGTSDASTLGPQSRTRQLTGPADDPSPAPVKAQSPTSDVPPPSWCPSRRAAQSFVVPPRSSQTSLLQSTDVTPSRASESADHSPSCTNRSSFESPANSPTRKSNVKRMGTNQTSFSSLPESNISARSRPSTRATTPEFSQASSPTASISNARHGTVDDRWTVTAKGEQTETNLVDETFVHELVYNKDGQIAGGSLPALVEQLTTHDSTPDSQFLSTFFLTFRVFTTPINLASALVHRFDYVASNATIAKVVQLRVYNIFKGWLENHWRNDCDAVALPTIREFASDQLMVAMPGVGVRLAALVQKVSAGRGPLSPRSFSCLGNASTLSAQFSSSESSVVPSVISKAQLVALTNWKQHGHSPSIMDFDPLEVARQLTIKESKVFCSILPEELLDQEWSRKSSSIGSNVRAKSRLSTQLTNLVTDTILDFHNAKKRAGVIKQWVKIANMCLELNNYDTLVAIMCSLNSAGVLRLKKTWEVVSTKTKTTLEMLRGIVDVSRNHAGLRQRLQHHESPCLPFLGIFLSDVGFCGVVFSRTWSRSTDGGDGGIATLHRRWQPV